MTTTLEKMGAVIEARVRAAGAIHDYDGVEIARAALQAIKEPDDAKTDLGSGCISWSRAIDTATMNAQMRDAFNEMIDAILREKA